MPIDNFGLIMELGLAAAVLCIVLLRIIDRRRRVSTLALALILLVVFGTAWTAVRYAALPGPGPSESRASPELSSRGAAFSASIRRSRYEMSSITARLELIRSAAIPVKIIWTPVRVRMAARMSD